MTEKILCKHCGREIEKYKTARGYTSYTHKSGDFGKLFCNLPHLARYCSAEPMEVSSHSSPK